jgi:membrane-associated phospholipid phosphatase
VGGAEADVDGDPVAARSRPDLRRHSSETSALATRYGEVLRPFHAVGWERVRASAYLAYVAILAWVIVIKGVPTGRTSLAVIVMIGLALTSIGRGWRQAGRVVVDWLPFTAVLLAYDRTRGVADTLGIELHEADVLHVEQWLFGSTEPALWLQQHLYHPGHVYWYDAACTIVYTSHFLATPVLAAFLWLRERALWLRYISRVITLSVAGLVTYCLFPEAPPWMAARDGLTDPIARLSARGWIWLHAGNLQTLLARGQNDGANPVAAMPSLHVAFAVLVAIVIAGRFRSRWRWLTALYPVAMSFTLVYCGEHYVIDLVAGVAYAVAVHLGLSRWEAARARRRADRADREDRDDRAPALEDLADASVH